MLKHDFSLMWCYWDQCWHHMVPVGLKMTSLHPLRQDNWNVAQLGHVIPVALVSESHDADGIINGTIAFLISKWLKWSEAWLFWSCAAIGIYTDSKWYYCIVNSTIAILRSRWLKWSATWLFAYRTPLAPALQSHDANCVGVTWYHLHQHQCHTIPTAS